MPGEAANHRRPPCPPPKSPRGRGPAADPGPLAAERAGPSASGPARSRGARAPGKGFTHNAAGEPGPRPPPLLPTTLGPAVHGPDCPRADLKVPLSSRSSGGAGARCRLWDMARREGSAAGRRAVRMDVLAPRVGRSPRGALQPPPPPSPQLPFSDPHPPLHPSCVPLAKRTGEGGASVRQRWSRFPVTPPCCPGSWPSPSSAPPAGSQSPRRPAPPLSARPRPGSRLWLPAPAGTSRAASAPLCTLCPVLPRPQFCVLKRRPFPAQRSLSGRQTSQNLWGLKLSLFYFWLRER